MSIPVFCHACGALDEVPRVMPNLMCRCGSREIDLFEGTTANLTAIAKAEQRMARRHANSGGTGWGKPMPDPLRGWTEYSGEMPSPTQFPNPQTHGDFPGRLCPTCHGSGYNLQEGEDCRECGGTGKMTPTTSVQPEPQVARHDYPSTQTKVPFIGNRVTATTMMTPEEVLRQTDPQYTDKGQRQPHKPNLPYSHEDSDTHYRKAPTVSPHIQDWQPARPPDPGKPYEMEGAECPNCGQNPTQLQKDKDEHAWWYCPNCGPLKDIDKHPEVDPYNPPAGFQADPKKFKTSSRLRGRGSPGVLLGMISTIASQNPGLSTWEALAVARDTIQRYAPEGR